MSNAAEMSQSRSPKKTDRFLMFPVVAAMLLWFFIEGQLISSPDPLGGLLPGPLILLSMLLVVAATVWSAAALMIFLITLKWRKILSITVALLIFVSGVAISAASTEFVRVWIGKVHLEAELSARKANHQDVSDLRWGVTQTDDSWTSLVYDETDRDKPGSGQVSKSWLDYSWLITGCKVLGRVDG